MPGEFHHQGACDLGREPARYSRPPQGAGCAALLCGPVLSTELAVSTSRDEVVFPSRTEKQVCAPRASVPPSRPPVLPGARGGRSTCMRAVQQMTDSPLSLTQASLVSVQGPRGSNRLTAGVDLQAGHSQACP